MLIRKIYALVITYWQVKEKKKQRRRLEFPIAENSIKAGSGYIKNKSRIVADDQIYGKSARNIRKNGNNRG